jgi:hypothetical protein
MIRRICRTLVLFGVLAAAIPFAAAGEADVTCSRVVSVGDLHGAYEAFVSILRETELIDEDLGWIGGDACLVQLGDVVDRGPNGRSILDLLMRLSEEHPGRVRPLLGNHETMALVRDLRYVSPEEYATFQKEETTQDRRRALRAFSQKVGPGATPAAVESKFDELYPVGWFGREKAFSPDGTYGAWLLARDAATKINGVVYVHGGLSLADAKLGLDAVNERIRADLRRYIDARDYLIEKRVLDPLDDFEGHVSAAIRYQEAIDSGAKRNPQEEVQAALTDVLAALDSSFLSREGPVWNRDLSREPEQEYGPVLTKTLAAVGAERIVVGHTPTDNRVVTTRFGGRAVMIDTGASPSYEGQVAALEIVDDEPTASAVYLDSREAIHAPETISDQEIEAWLAKGEITERRVIGTGVTKPEKLVLQWKGATRKAAFKFHDEYPPKRMRLPDGRVEPDFTDRYHYDVAAYRLDRMLGLGRVPVAVLRTVEGRPGAVVDWIEGAMTEEERRNDGVPPPPYGALARQKAETAVFDALIANVDRNLGNLLYIPESGKFWLIDHTRAFRMSKALPRVYAKEPSRIPKDLYDRLVALDPAEVERQMEGLLNAAQIKALLARRDRIVEKIEKDRGKLGDEAVFGSLSDDDDIPDPTPEWEELHLEEEVAASGAD